MQAALLNVAALYGCKKDGVIDPGITPRVSEGIVSEVTLSGTEGNSPDDARRVTNVYHSYSPDLPENYVLGRKLSYFNGRIYIPCREVIDQTNPMMRIVLYSFDIMGENARNIPIEFGVESNYINIINLLHSPDGSFVVVAALYNQTSVEIQSFQLIKKAPDGSTVFTADLIPLFPDSDTGENRSNGSFNINLAALDGEGNIYLGSQGSDSSALICLSSDGKKLFDIPINGFFSDIAVGADGCVFVKYRYFVDAGIETEIRCVDIPKKGLGEKITIPFTGADLVNSEIFIGAGYDLYVKNDIGLYGVNLSETEPVLLADWLNSDLNPDNVLSLVVISSDRFACIGYDQLTGKSQIAFLTRVPDNEVTLKF